MPKRQIIYLDVEIRRTIPAAPYMEIKQLKIGLIEANKKKERKIKIK